MHRTVDFLDDVKRRYGLTSDYQVSQLLGLTRSAVSGYRTGDHAMDETVALVVAEKLELAPAYVLACVAAERSKEPKARRVWESLAKKIAAIVIVVMGSQGGGFTVDDARATPVLHKQNYGQHESVSSATVLHIMRISRRMSQAARPCLPQLSVVRLSCRAL